MQKRAYHSLIWGGLLIVLGLALIANNMGWLGDWNVPIWSLILGAFSLVFLVTYLGDRTQWWALIPGLVILGIAVAVFLAEQDLVSGEIVATFILGGIGLPFLLIFVTDRRHWWALIPGMTMSGIALAVLLGGLELISGTAVAGIIVGGVSLGFLSIYLADREQWWALIPGGIVGTVAFFLLMATVVEYVWPIALILLGLLLLRSSLGRGQRRSRPPADRAHPSPPPAKPIPQERQRMPTLEEQIEAAIAEEPEVIEDAEIVSESEPETDVSEQQAKETPPAEQEDKDEDAPANDQDPDTPASPLQT